MRHPQGIWVTLQLNWRESLECFTCHRLIVLPTGDLGYSATQLERVTCVLHLPSTAPVLCSFSAFSLHSDSATPTPSPMSHARLSEVALCLTKSLCSLLTLPTPTSCHHTSYDQERVALSLFNSESTVLRCLHLHALPSFCLSLSFTLDSPLSFLLPSIDESE